MIDHYNLIMNAFWIVGCAVALATLSYASWEASVQGEKFLTHLGQTHLRIALNFGGFLFCVGLAGTSDALWQRILWVILCFGFLVQIGGEFYQKYTQEKHSI